MRNTSLAMLLAMALAPKSSFAKPHHCPGLDNAKRVGAEGEQGTVLLEVDTLFKCHGDSESFDGAMAGLAGDLNGHSRRAFGIVTFGDDGYFAFVKAPFRVSAPVFFVQEETSYACVTVQHSNTHCTDHQDSEIIAIEVDAELDTAADPAPPDGIRQWPSRLLQANFDAGDSDVQTKLEDERNDYRKPQPPPIENTPAALPEARGKDPNQLPMQAGNIELRKPQPPEPSSQPLPVDAQSKPRSEEHKQD